MTRNTVRRVEIATPIYDRYIQKRLRQMFQIMLMDDEKGKEQGRLFLTGEEGFFHGNP